VPVWRSAFHWLGFHHPPPRDPSSTRHHTGLQADVLDKCRRYLSVAKSIFLTEKKPRLHKVRSQSEHYEVLPGSKRCLLHLQRVSTLHVVARQSLAPLTWLSIGGHPETSYVGLELCRCRTKPEV
jgi:hypothetical protein